MLQKTFYYIKNDSINRKNRTFANRQIRDYYLNS